MLIKHNRTVTVARAVVVLIVLILGGLGCGRTGTADAGGSGGASTDAGMGGVAAGTGGSVVQGTGGTVVAQGTGGAVVAQGTGGSAVVQGTGGSVVAGTGGAGTGGTTGAAGSGSGGGGAGGDDSSLPCHAPWADVQLGTAVDDQILGMTIDANDDIIASGYEQGTLGVTNIEPDGNSRAIVMKYGPDGAMTWKTVLDTPGTDTAEDVALDRASGALVVVGRTSGAFPTFANQGQFDLVLAALAPDGQIASIFQGGNERPQHPARVSLAPGGAIAVGGWDDTYAPNNAVDAQPDGFIGSFSMDASASHAITQSSLQYLVPPGPLAPFSLVTGVAAETDGSGDIYVISLIASNHVTEQGIFLKRLRADLSVVWSGTISTDPSGVVNAVVLSPSGDLFITGLVRGELFLIKVDRQTGVPVWVVERSGPGSGYPTALAVDRDGNVYVAGLTEGSVVDGVDNQGSFDIFALKFSPTGAPLGAWQRGTPAFDRATSLTVDRCGRVFVAGDTGGAIVPGRTNAGGQDMFLMNVEF